LLFGSGQSTPYFREKMATYAISILGLDEAAQAHTGSELRKESLAFGEKVLEALRKQSVAASESHGMRFVVSLRPGDDAAPRLAELDVEQYGKGNVSTQGGRGSPLYTDLSIVPLTSKVPVNERLAIEGASQALTAGGHLTTISISNHVAPDTLLSLTRDAGANRVRFIAYSGLYSFCRNCGRIINGLVPTCNTCGSDNITQYGRSSATYLPLSLWPEGKKRTIEKRTIYPLP
jgi:anaerobic ribonucleoside-triphosphate reductase